MATVKPDELNWDKVRATFGADDAPACVTAVVQDAECGEILMVGHANLQAVERFSSLV